jgi:hydrogenase maturation protein HypF
MVGSDLAAKYPLRMVAGILSEKDNVDEWILSKADLFPHGEKEVEIMFKQLSGELPVTTSCGRILDAVSALLGICYERTYEGEPAMKLESLADGDSTRDPIFKPEISEKGREMELNTHNILKYFLDNLKNTKKEKIASTAQNYLALGFTEMATRAAKDNGIKKVAISGGVLANECISKFLRERLTKNNHEVILNEKVPIGDGCSALGQACHALSTVI